MNVGFALGQITAVGGALRQGIRKSLISRRKEGSTIEIPGLELNNSLSLPNSGHRSNIDRAMESKMLHFSPKTTALIVRGTLLRFRRRCRCSTMADRSS
jgi:hypothetical protein